MYFQVEPGEGESEGETGREIGSNFQGSMICCKFPGFNDLLKFPGLNEMLKSIENVDGKYVLLILYPDP